MQLHYLGGVVVIGAMAGLASGATIVGNYTFTGGSLSSTVGSPPALILDDYGQPVTYTQTMINNTNDTVLNFSDSTDYDGLRFDAAGFGNFAASGFSVAMLINPDNIGASTHRRVLSFNGNSNDNGLYIRGDGALSFWQGGDQGVLQTGVISNGASSVPAFNGYYNVVYTYDPLGNQIRGYVDGQLVLSWASSQSALTQQFLTFFRDDGTEHLRGSVATIRVWDGVLGAGEVSNLNLLDDPGSVIPLPSAGAMAGIGLIALGARGRSRR